MTNHSVDISAVGGLPGENVLCKQTEANEVKCKQPMRPREDYMGVSRSSLENFL